MVQLYTKEFCVGNFRKDQDMEGSKFFFSHQALYFRNLTCFLLFPSIFYLQGEERAYKFVQDFVMPQLIGHDVNDLWNIVNPMGILEKILAKQNRGAPEPRWGQFCVFVVFYCFHVFLCSPHLFLWGLNLSLCGLHPACLTEQCDAMYHKCHISNPSIVLPLTKSDSKLCFRIFGRVYSQTSI